MMRTLIQRSTIQREAVNQMARTIDDVEPPPLQVTQDGGILLSELRNGLKGMDEGRADVRRFDAILIADHFITISEVEIVAGRHEKLPCFPLKSRMASKCSNYLSKSPLRKGVLSKSMPQVGVVRLGQAETFRLIPWQMRDRMWGDFRQGDAEACFQFTGQPLNAAHGMSEMAQVPTVLQNQTVIRSRTVVNNETVIHPEQVHTARTVLRPEMEITTGTVNRRIDVDADTDTGSIERRLLRNAAFQ